MMSDDNWPRDENDLTDDQVFKMWGERQPVRLRWFHLSSNPDWLIDDESLAFGETAFTFRFEWYEGQVRKVSERVEPVAEEVSA